jgi:hypothetical protein
MANYQPKGEEYMRLASRGGQASVETRRKDRVAKLLGIPPVPAELLKRPNLSGGSHDNDWRCPSCHHFNSEKRRACAKCNNVAPANGRITRRALRAREKEHRTQGYLRKVGLLAPDSAPSPVGSQQ